MGREAVQVKTRYLLMSELCDKAGIKYSTALVVLLGCRKLELLLAVFHKCQREPVQLKPFGAGFPNMPYRCLCCGVLVRDMDYLRFDTLIRIREKKISL